MKNIPEDLLLAFKKPGKSTCFAVKIISSEGDIIAATTLDAAFQFNDGFHDLNYTPIQALIPQKIEESNDINEVDNTELHGTFTDEVERLLIAGKFLSAKITIYRLAYLMKPLAAEIVSYGTLGRVDYQADSSGYRKLEWNGIDDYLATHQNAVYSLTCRNDFGDDRCQMPFIWEGPYVIAEVDDARLRVRVTGPTHVDPFYYSLGVMRGDTGDNMGATLEVEEWEPTVDGGWVNLSFATPYNMDIGDQISLRQDCNKYSVTCIAYNNMINFNGEHLMPVQDAGLMAPGAYTKSRNAL